MSNPYSSPTKSNDVQLEASVQQAVKQLRIVSFALICSVMAFAGVTLVANGFKFDGDPDVMSWIGIGFAAIVIVNSFVVPRIISTSMLRSLPTDQTGVSSPSDRIEKLLGVFRSQHIVGCALLEGGAFLNLVMAMISPFVGSLVTVAVLMVLMLIRLPSTSSVQFWVQDRSQEMTSI